MAEQHWVHLYDENGMGPHDSVDLPRTVEGLKDDPYRSLAAAAVRDNGDFAKVPTPFVKLEWAICFGSFDISVADTDGDLKAPSGRLRLSH